MLLIILSIILLFKISYSFTVSEITYKFLNVNDTVASFVLKFKKLNFTCVTTNGLILIISRYLRATAIFLDDG